MSIYIAIVIELLIIASIILLWRKDKKMFEVIWDQIIEILKEIDGVKKEKKKISNKTAIKKKKI